MAKKGEVNFSSGLKRLCRWNEVAATYEEMLPSNREGRISNLACLLSIIVGRRCHGLSKVSNDAIVVLCSARRFSPPVRGSTVVGITPPCRRRTRSRNT